ncbi:MAG TPA: hypothetical protein VKG79_06660 [Bryobacteraceae bacterium]|nr:hypothetical protein [Bryobacteraceae bacterium]
MTRPMPRATLGCRSHSGWAALVALAGSPEAPQVIDRRRIEIADSGIRGSKQPYHAAEPMEFPDAQAFLKRCERSTSRLAVQSLRGAIGDIRALGFQASDLGVTLGSGRPLPALKNVLSSHALIHTAEGEFYRQEMLKAGKQCGLAVLGVKERELYARASLQFHLPLDELERRVSDLGKPIGPPWSQDQKCAALIAWLALAGPI